MSLAGETTGRTDCSKFPVAYGQRELPALVSSAVAWVAQR